VNALRRIHRSLVKGGILLDLQPMLDNAPVTNPDGELGRLDEREFRAFADRVNLALEGTIREGLFAHEREACFDVVHRFNGAAELLAEVKTWKGTTVPEALLGSIEKSRSPFEVHEGARLRRLRAL
jgi:hypothetical protein